MRSVPGDGLTAIDTAGQSVWRLAPADYPASFLASIAMQSENSHRKTHADGKNDKPKLKLSAASETDCKAVHWP